MTTGGTGGHINPALAVAEEFRNNGDTVLFMGGLYGPEQEKARQAGFEFIGVDVKGMDRGNIWQAVKAVARFPFAVAAAYRTLSVFAPHAVVGAGGYASAPAAVGALMKDIPLFLMEQNVYPGLVTRKLARRARRVFTTFAQTQRWLTGADIEVTGNPVKKGFAFAGRAKKPGEAFSLLVMGGSQGARSINRAVVEALPALKEMQVSIHHQTGPAGYEETKAAYEREGVAAVVAPYFDTMDELMAKADLAVCRAGASTCAELAMSGLPSIMVPYPYAGGHQKLNAQAMVDGGAAVLLPDEEANGHTLMARIKELMIKAEDRELMAANAREMAKPDAAVTVYRTVTEMVS